VVQVRDSELNGGVPETPHAPRRIVLERRCEYFGEETVYPRVTDFIHLNSGLLLLL
jgi:hypothetical protein